MRFETVVFSRHGGRSYENDLRGAPETRGLSNPLDLRRSARVPDDEVRGTDAEPLRLADSFTRGGCVRLPNIEVYGPLLVRFRSLVRCALGRLARAHDDDACRVGPQLLVGNPESSPVTLGGCIDILDDEVHGPGSVRLSRFNPWALGRIGALMIMTPVGSGQNLGGFYFTRRHFDGLRAFIMMTLVGSGQKIL